MIQNAIIAANKYILFLDFDLHDSLNAARMLNYYLVLVVELFAFLNFIFSLSFLDKKCLHIHFIRGMCSFAFCTDIFTGSFRSLPFIGPAIGAAQIYFVHRHNSPFENFKCDVSLCVR